MLSKNQEHYWRNAFIMITMVFIVFLIPKIVYGDKIGLTCICITWSLAGFISNLILIVKSWYTGLPFSVGHIIQLLFSCVLGPIIAFCIYQFGTECIYEHFYEKHNNFYLISKGRKSAIVLRVLSQ